MAATTAPSSRPTMAPQFAQPTSSLTKELQPHNAAQTLRSRTRLAPLRLKSQQASSYHNTCCRGEESLPTKLQPNGNESWLVLGFAFPTRVHGISTSLLAGQLIPIVLSA